MSHAAACAAAQARARASSITTEHRNVGRSQKRARDDEVIYDFGRPQVLNQPRRIYLGNDSQSLGVRPLTPETRPCTDEMVSELLSSLADLLRTEADDASAEQASGELSMQEPPTLSSFNATCETRNDSDSGEGESMPDDVTDGKTLRSHVLKVLGVLTAGAAIGTGAGALAGSMLVGSGVAIAAATGSSTALWFRRIKPRSSSKLVTNE